MGWQDKYARSQFLKIRDEYKISTFVETGAFRGATTRYFSFHFNEVLSCDINENYFNISRDYNKDRNNVKIEKMNSKDFIRNFVTQYYKDKRTDIVFFFLDAHFYDASLMPNEKWVVLDEIKSLSGFKNCVICIHDFDCSGLGHCCYGGEPLGFPLVLPYLNLVNPNFYYYVNDRKRCNMVTEEEFKNFKEMLNNDLVLETVRYSNSSDAMQYRGFLYCTPTELDLNKHDLRRA